MLSATVVNELIAKAADEKRVNVFIVDDRVYTRGRSKKVELLSWVRDHSKHLSVRGFRLLTLGWSDGNSFIPVSGCLLASTAKRCHDLEYTILISTDTSLPEEEVIRIYGKRWSIEVFFKICKSYLKLTGECRSMSYDAMTAYVAIVFARYMMLSVENRMQVDERSLGELFYNVCDELPDITWVEAFRILYLCRLLICQGSRRFFRVRSLSLLF